MTTDRSGTEPRTDRADLVFGTIARMAQASAQRWPDHVAVVDGEAVRTFRQVADEALAVTAALVSLGVEHGDRVALWAPNSASWITAALGIHGAGAWLVPLNTRFKAPEAGYILQRSGARVVLVVDDFMGTDYAAMVHSQHRQLPALEHVITIPPPGIASTSAWHEFLASGVEVRDEATARIAAGAADDICDIIFTSGTTGKPKGVLLRHGTSLRCYQSYNDAYGLTEGSQHLVTTPFFHCFGYKAGWMVSLMTGATTHPMAVFDAERTLQTVQTHRITHMPGAPTVFSALLQHPRRSTCDLSSLDTAIVAAASIPEQLIHDMADGLGFRNILSGYGLTENHALGTFTRPGDPLSLVSRTVGRAAPDITIRIVDDEGHDVPTGTAGEVLLGGYAHMTGYYEDPTATAACIRDGWLYTGDVGVLDTDGSLRITDRKKDMFIVGGFNVAPAEVEHGLRSLAGVADVAVVGMPDAHFGEVGCAFVVPLAGVTLTADAVIAHARATMANYKVPRRVEIVATLPTNATGKVLRHVLRDEARALAAEEGR